MLSIHIFDSQSPHPAVRLLSLALVFALTSCGDDTGTESASSLGGTLGGGTTTMSSTDGTAMLTSDGETTGGDVSTTSGATSTNTTTGRDTSTTTGSTSVGTDTGVDGPCSLPTPIGDDAKGLVVEPCKVLDEPLRGWGIGGLAIDTKGAILVNVTGQETIRLVDSEGPGCELTRAPADDLPQGEWDEIEVLDDGTIYQSDDTGFPTTFISSGTKSKICPNVPVSVWGRLGFRDGQAIFGSSDHANPILFDVDTCTADVVETIPVDVRGAMFYDDDVILAEHKRLYRWTLDGEKMWEASDSWQFGQDIVRCGDDICLPIGGGAYLGRYASADGELLAQYDTIPLFGFDAIIDAIGTSPDHAAILVAFEIEHPDPECSDNYMKNIQIYRVSGF